MSDATTTATEPKKTITVYRGDAASKAETVLNEGLRLTAYQCSANVWTIGVGIATTSGVRVRGMLNGEFYEGKPCPGLTITREEAMRVFDNHYAELEEKVSPLLTHAPTPGQMGAFLDFAHQFGANAFLTSDLLKAYNFNPTNPAVLSEFVRWSRAGGKHDKGVFWRSMRRAVMFAGLAVPKWMHTPKELPFAVIDGDPSTHKDDEIDYSQVPSVHQVIALVKAGEKPWTAKPAFKPPGVWADEHEANAVAAPGWPRPKPDPVRTSPEAARETESPPNPPSSSPSVSSPQVSSPAVEGEGAGATVVPAPAPEPPVSVSPLPPVTGPVPGAGKIGTAPAKPAAPVPVPMPPTPPAKIVLPSQLPPDEDTGLRSIFASKRFYGAFLIVFGRIFTVLNVASFAPGLGFIQTFLSDAVILDGASSAFAWMAGEALMRVGEDKSKGKVLATPREIALATKPKENA